MLRIFTYIKKVMINKTLRSLLRSSRPTYIMEAHNGLSARIVEKTGFEAIWASGLSMSASNGVRDSNELTTSEILYTLKFFQRVCQRKISNLLQTKYSS